MSSIQEKVRSTAAELLEQNKADLVIGFSEGSLPMKATPCFVTTPEAAKRLVWNSYCSNNLAVYLPACFAPDPRLKEAPAPPKVAIIAKGCDGRSAVGLIKELQVPRENLLIVAVPCEGMLDAQLAQRLLGTDEIVASEEADGKVTVRDGAGKEAQFNRAELLAEACRFCSQRAPAVFDMMIGELPRTESTQEADDAFEQFSNRPLSERWQQFCREISKCMLCKGCRNACPNCYCKTCFADQTRPKWLNSGYEFRDLIFYHLGRMFHQAGRCVDCGACVRACPMGVDLRTFTYKLVKDAEDSFGYTTGIDLDQPPPLLATSADDPESFITEPE